ncbi:MAG: N-formylglutamate deformylase, partial [Sphingomonadales bacterium]
SVLNGRFKGGWTTRRYGQPERGVHAIQMEIAQSTYLESETPPFALSSAKSARLRALLSRVFDAIQDTFGDLT